MVNDELKVLSQVSLLESAKWLRLHFCYMVRSERSTLTPSFNKCHLWTYLMCGASVSKKRITCCEGLCYTDMIWQGNAGIMYSYSKSKTRGAELAFNVLLCVFRTSSQSRALTLKQMHTYNRKTLSQTDWGVTLSGWNLSTWHCKHSHPIAYCSSGSSFICRHSNVNSLSLSISKKDYTGSSLQMTSPPVRLVEKEKLWKPNKSQGHCWMLSAMLFYWLWLIVRI